MDRAIEAEKHMRKLMRRLLYALRFRRVEAELAEELDFHRERLQHDMEAGGLRPEHAAAATRRELGSVTLAREQARDVWIWPWLQDAAQDVRFAARMLVKDPRFTCAIVLTLGLGVGATNTVFTLVNTVMLRDMPFERADRLVALGTRNAKGRGAGVSYADYRDWSAAARTFSGITAVTHGGGMILRDHRGAPQRLRGQFVSANTFQVLRRRPIIGRDFLPSDDRPDASAVVMLGYDVWHGRYGGDPGVIGTIVQINDVPSTIIGVMPEGFAYSFTSQVWQPLSLAPRLDRVKRDARGLEVVGRLADGSDREAGRAELEAIGGQLAREYPETNAGVTPTVRRLNEGFLRGTKPILFTLMGAVVFVLLIACANVSNLLLVRAVARAREMAVRASLGATRWRLMRQLLIECLLLAVLAGGLGLLLSVFGVRFLGTGFGSWEVEAPAVANMPYWVDLSMNWVVFLFLSGVCLATSLLFGLAPAWHVSKTNANALLKEDGRGAAGSRPAQRLTSAFVVAEIALTLVLLTGAGLLARSFLTVYYTDYAIDTPHLAVMRLALSERKYPTSEARARVLARLDERLASLSAGEAGEAGRVGGARAGGASSGIVSAVVASDMPFSVGRTSRQLAIEGRPPADGKAPFEVAYVYASDRYFSTVGLRIVRGRPLARGDDASGREGAVVNDRFAATHFPNEDPIGRRIRLAAANNAQSQTWFTIVGVARNMPRAGSDRLPEPLVYVPLGGEPAPGALASLIVRTANRQRAEALETDGARSTRLAAVTARLREEVLAVDPDLPLYSVETMDAVVARGWSGQRLMGGFMGMLAFIALVLATVGLYAVTAHGVARRTQEIGVRMALGARAGQVVWLFARRSLWQLALGVTLGLAGALAVGRLLQAFLVGTEPRDTATLAVVALLLVAVTSAASYFPARHAARLDPLRALRDE
jgi:putative ABC transport system permease protein